MKQKRIFLRRSKVPNALSEFFIGGAINIHGRQHNVTGYADNFTAQELGNRLERTLLVVKPDAVAKLSEILSAIASTGAFCRSFLCPSIRGLGVSFGCVWVWGGTGGDPGHTASLHPLSPPFAAARTLG